MILCCGEALIDMLPRKTTLGEDAYAPHLGGAVFNTARALGRLGVPTAFFSGLSTDLFGRRLSAALEESGVDLSLVRFSDLPTTLAFVELDGKDARYAFYDENTAGRMIGPDELPEIPGSVAALHFSCISLVAEPCGSAYEALATREAGRRIIMLDPNIRTSIIADRQRHLERMRRMIGLADIVKLSAEDLAWFGEAGDLEEIAGRWLKLGPKLIVVTHGGEGASAWFAGGMVRVGVDPVEVADTVGAGDTFNAGLLAFLHEHGLLSKDRIAGIEREEAEAALRFAARAAAVTVSRPGANPPWRREMAVG